MNCWFWALDVMGNSSFLAAVELWIKGERRGEWWGVAVLCASFHGWQKMESPQWVPPSAQRSQGRGTLGTERVKRERELGRMEQEREGVRGSAITWDRSNRSWLISCVPCLPLFPSTPLSQWTSSLQSSVLSRRLRNRGDHNVCSGQPVDHLLLVHWKMQRIWLLFLQIHAQMVFTPIKAILLGVKVCWIQWCTNYYENWQTIK